jgi:hypothetical protein
VAEVHLVRYLRRDAGVSLATIKASVRPLIAGLGLSQKS